MDDIDVTDRFRWRSMDMKRYVCAMSLVLLAIWAERGTGADEMSQYASAQTTTELLSRFPGKAYLTFPEPRERSIRILDGIPQAWTQRDRADLTAFSGNARPGEYFVFQVGVFAARANVENLRVRFSDLEGSTLIGKSALTCFNLEGVDPLGHPFAKRIDVPKERVQPLWFGVRIPPDAKGTYTGALTILCKNAPETPMALAFHVTGSVLSNEGVDDAARFARLAWLNSTIAHDDEVTRGYRPLVRKGRTFDILGRQVRLSRSGLPAAISSFFGPNNQTLSAEGQSILGARFRFVIETSEGKTLRLRPKELRFTKEVSSTLAWTVKSTSDEVELLLEAHAEFDGFLAYTLKLNPLQDLQVKDIRLEIPLAPNMSKYMMGMGQTGGLRPDEWNWKWDVQKKSQDAVWVGGVNGGLRLKLKGANYRRQLVNIYYEYCPLNQPKSWGNDGRGGADILTTSEGALIKAYCGARELRKGQTLSCSLPRPKRAAPILSTSITAKISTRSSIIPISQRTCRS